MTEWSGVALHSSMHDVNEIHLYAHQSVDGFLFSLVRSWHSL